MRKRRGYGPIVRAGTVVPAVAVMIALGVMRTSPAGAGVPPPTTPSEAQAQCAPFAELNDSFDTISVQATTAKTFQTIHHMTQVFRRVAASAPDEIADEIRVLAASITALDRRLAPLAAKLHSTRSQAKYDAMIDPVRRAFAAWTKSQHQEKLATAQNRVQEWLATTCGFRLGNGESAGTTASCDSAEAAVHAVFAAWQAGDRPTAAACGAAAAITELFSLPQAIQMTYEGCAGIDATNVDCTYRYEGGSLTMTATKSGDGWKVTKVTGHPD